MIGSTFGLLLMVAGIVSFAACVLAAFAGYPTAAIGNSAILSLILMGVAEIVMRLGKGGGNG